MTTHYLYNDSVHLTFDPEKHEYTVDGIPVASVTQILKVINKPALMPWAALMTSDYWKESIHPGESYDEIQLEQIWKDAKASFRQKSSAAASIGTLVHDYAEQVGMGNNPKHPVNEQAKKGCEAFDLWVEESEVDFIDTEFKVYSKEYDFVGTCDLDCLINGERVLIDYKTSSGIYPEMWLQTAAYALARNEELGIDYDKRAIALFNKKTGKFKVEYRDMGLEYVNDKLAFISAMSLSECLKDI